MSKDIKDMDVYDYLEAMFKIDNKKGITELVDHLVDRIVSDKETILKLQKTNEMFWPEVDEKIKKIQAKADFMQNTMSKENQVLFKILKRHGLEEEFKQEVLNAKQSKVVTKKQKAS